MPGKKQITAIILAGGKSSRMAKDKGLVQLNEKPLIGHVIEKLKNITDQIIIITPNPEYQQFGYPCFGDEMKEKGPLGGIFTGLMHSTTRKNLFLGCDMPRLSETLLNALIENSGEEDALITEHEGKAEPLCSIYDRSCIPHFRKLLEQDNLKITNALAGLNTRTVSFDGEPWLKGNEFANINSAEELLKFQQNKNNP